MKLFSKPWRRLLLLSSILVAPSLANAQEVADEAPPADDGEIVVLGRHIPEPQQESFTVSNFLSAEELSRQGDSNAALALTRVTGLSVVSGRFVYVRGLGDRYSSALLNGSPLPSPEPLRRQVPLDLFPSNILDGATVQKTFSPDLPGEFGGGVIDLRTVSIPNETFFTFKLGTGGNTESTDHRGLTYYGESSDWTGMADGLRDVPAPIQAAISSGRRIDANNFTPAQLEAMGESLVNSPLTVIQYEHHDPDFETEATAGTSIDIGKYNIGLVGVVGYDSQTRLQTAHRQRVVGGQIENDDRVATSNWDVVLNGFGSASIGWDDNQITLTGLIVRSTTKKAQIGERAFDANRGGNPVHSESTAWYERELGSLQLAGEHEFGPLTLDWRTAYAQSTRDAPYEREVQYERTPLFPIIYSGRGTDNSIRFSELIDQVLSAGVDATYTLPLSDTRDLLLAGGVSYSNTIRDYTQRTFAFTEPFPALINNTTRQARADYLFSPDSIRPDGFQLQEFTGRDDSYKGRLTVMSGYLMADVDVLPLVHVSLGARYEDATEIVRTYNTVNETPFVRPVTLANDYILPSVTATWNFAEDLQARVAFSQTIARPQFRELAFSPYLDPETDRTYQGNPFLQDSEFDNWDSRLEYYFGRDQFVTVGAFYKKITNPIEEVITPTQGDIFTKFINAPEATLYGAEAEFRTKFDAPWDILPFLEGEQWLFAVNYTYTHSEVTAGQECLVNPSVSPSAVNFAGFGSCNPSDGFARASALIVDGSPLQGTPESIVNLQFGLETASSQLTLLVGWVDERIARRGLGALPTVIEDPGVNVDLVFRRDFTVGDNLVTLGLSGRNLLDEQHSEYQNSAAGRTDANTYDRGMSFSASLTAKF